MSQLLERAAYGPRNEVLFIQEMNILTRHHLDGCPLYAKVWLGWQPATDVSEIPFLHVGVFKHLEFKTAVPGICYERTLRSSGTTSGIASRIPLDTKSSHFQSCSSAAILKDFLGEVPKPLLVLDSSRSLQTRGEVSARIAAAMSLRPLASDISFLLDEAENPASINWARFECSSGEHNDLLVYGFTWMLWLAWATQEKPPAIRHALSNKRIHFVHSGGWKKMESLNVSREQFNHDLLQGLAPGSSVLDFYGLVEQAGIIYPLCEAGFRHVPVWADVLVRDPLTLKPSASGNTGLLQLLNTLAWGAPYHSVLTEDLGRIEPGPCSCGRSGARFEVIGRVPKAELRGCANV